MRFILGVDEAGRGPLAGPVSVGIVAVPEGFDVAAEFPGVADSKKLSEKNREKLFAMLEARVALGDARYRVEFESAGNIDREGIAIVIRRAVSRGVNALAPDAALVHIQLDGALRAPAEYAQETIINGDELIPIISLASIAAKVVRDRLMIKLSVEYPQYGFEQHKGYGTKAHYEMLGKHGLCVIHRRSFIHLDSNGK
ncbi:MAG: ribonuclease HII [Candidatus Parcubacteria bacterium]|nr:ribonuclease HII [Candidatus Parcubacteria bacterium]